MILSVVKDMHLCLWSYLLQRNLCIFHASVPINFLMFIFFFPVQRHEDSWKLACLMYPAAFHNEKLVIKFVDLVTGREESILSVVGIKAAAGYLQNKWEKVTVLTFF